MTTDTRHRPTVVFKRNGTVSVDGHIVGTWDKYSDWGPGSIGNYYGVDLGGEEWAEDRYLGNLRERLVTRFSGLDAGIEAAAREYASFVATKLPS